MPQRLAVENIKTFTQGDDIDGVWEAGGYIWIKVGNGTEDDFWRYDPKSRRYSLIVEGEDFAGSSSNTIIKIVQYGANTYGLGDVNGELFILRDGDWVEVAQVGATDMIVHEGRLFLGGGGPTYYFNSESDIGTANFGELIDATNVAEYLFSLNGSLYALVASDLSASYYPLLKEENGTWVELTDYSVSGVMFGYNAVVGKVTKPYWIDNFDFETTTISGWTEYDSGGSWGTTLWSGDWTARCNNTTSSKILGAEFFVHAGTRMQIDFSFMQSAGVPETVLTLWGYTNGAWEPIQELARTDSLVLPLPKYSKTIVATKDYSRLGIKY